MPPRKRIVVIGNAGTGKSTLGRMAGSALRLPTFHLDTLMWRLGSQPMPAHEFRRQHSAIVACDAWIIEGLATLESVLERVAAADTFVFLDYQLWRVYLWALKRQVQSIWQPRREMLANCPMLPKTWALVTLISLVHEQVRPQILELLGTELSWKTCE